MIFLIVLFFGFSVFGMERQGTMIRSNSSPDIVVSPLTEKSSSSDEDELCDVAIAHYIKDVPELSSYIRQHLKESLSLKVIEPNDIDRQECLNQTNADMLRRIKSGDDQYRIHEGKIHALVLNAMHDSFKERDKIIEKKEARIKEKYSGKKTAMYSAITGFIATIVSSVCTAIIAVHSKN